MTEQEADELVDRITTLYPTWGVILGTDQSGEFFVAATENPSEKPGGPGGRSWWSVSYLFEQPEDFDDYDPHSSTEEI